MNEPLTLPPERFAADMARLRAQSPLVHCITNLVVTGFTANALLAAGAAPAMIVAVEEAGEFARIAGGLLVNLGTITEPSAAAMRAAVAAAGDSGTPWVLDPVAAGAVGYRTAVATELLQAGPTVVRGNASEILALSGQGAGGRGVDTAAESADALDAARALAAERRTVVAVSGAVDYITDGDALIAIEGGDPMMTKVTGVGCALGAVMAAFLAVDGSPVHAAAAASQLFAVAGAEARRIADAPGSYAVAFLDCLHRVGGGPDAAGARAR